MAMSRIDAHQHFWSYDPGRHAWITEDMKKIRRDFAPSDLEPLLQAHGFSGCVTVQVDQTEEETLQLVSLAETHPFIAGVVGWVDLRSEALPSRLDYFSKWKQLKGFRHIVQAESPGFLEQPGFIRGVQQLQAFGFTYDLLIYHNQLPEAAAFVAQIPDTKIVIDHIAKPSIATGDLDQWKKYMRVLAGHANVWCKVSGMVTEARWHDWKYEDFVPYLDAVVEAFGVDRLLYGSDWPVCNVAATYDEQFSIVDRYFSAFSDAEKRMVLGDNARGFYNL